MYDLIFFEFLFLQVKLKKPLLEIYHTFFLKYDFRVLDIKSIVNARKIVIIILEK